MSVDSLSASSSGIPGQKRPAAVWGYAAGIITGVTYGLNPLFAVPLIRQGISVDTILLFRYLLAVVILGGWLAVRKENFRVSRKQVSRLVLLGLLFSMSSLTLFEAYNYIPSGVATTIVFLYPVLVAIIMVFMRVYPTWQVWLAIVMTFVGVLFLCRTDGNGMLHWRGLALSFASALAYAMFIVIVNRSTRIRNIPSTVLTFYSLLVGSVVFFAMAMSEGHTLTEGIAGPAAWLSLLGLAVLPTIVSTATLAVATRLIGATKASVLGVFEPVTAILVGAIAFGEPVTTNVIIGIVLTMAAITFLVISSSQKA